MTFGLGNLFIFGKLSEFYYTSQMFSQNGEICLQNTCQSVAHYQSQTIFKQNANDIKNI